MEIYKICFKCGIEKSINDFYKHPKMPDGHLNKCKECSINDTHKNTERLKKEDPEYCERERKRCREKYSRLNYKNKYLYHNEKFKFRKSSKFKNIHRKLKLTKEKEVHHWNYNEGYEENIFILTKSQHKQIHAKMFLDIEFLVYRTKNAELLDTREKHENYINKFLI